MASTPNPLANLLTNSTTKVERSSYVPLNDSRTTSSPSGRAIAKANFVASLRLQIGEVDSVQKALAPAGNTPATNVPRDNAFWSLLREFEGTPLPSQLPAPSAFVDVVPTDLLAFGNTLVTVRQQLVEGLQHPAPAAANGAAAAPVSAVSAATLGSAIDLLNTAVSQTKNFNTNMSVSPVGMLNLERLEMTAVGIERGGLVATIPLAPLEQTFVSQKEWSVTEQEFTSIVTDSLDNYSETGVTENTQLTQATNSQIAHNNQFNVTASASGGIGFVSGSTSTSFGSQDQSSLSAQNSRQDAVQTTRMASSRVKQSHKMTISTSSIQGTSDATTRKLVNPSTIDPMRIDYFSMMRKWYVALYRYGLRLTYDLTIPEPGAAMRETYAQLDILQKASSQQFVFPVKHSDINDTNYLKLADQYGVDLPPPPSPDLIKINLNCGTSTTDSLNPNKFTVPDGYWISRVLFESATADQSDWSNLSYYVDYVGTVISPGTDPWYGKIDLCAGQTFLWHQTGDQFLQIFFNTPDNEPTSELSFTIECVPTDTAMAQWVSSVWTALYNAAQTQFYAQQQSINAQITALQNSIQNVDTLTLRREENDEIMKGVLKWLMGPGFFFMPDAVQKAFKAAASAASAESGFSIPDVLHYGIDFTGNQTGLSAGQWSALSRQEQLISFINEAIEWENVTFFLYSYFWDEPLCWDFIRQIQHPDKTRQAFLRAGSARVVLTVRQGWEMAWTYFVNTAKFPIPASIPGAPYLTIAQQVAAYDSTNYPGIPPANPSGGGLIDDDTPQFGTTCATALAASASPATIPVADNSGFVVGATAIIDNWNAQIDPSTGIGVQETQTITAVSIPPAPPTITVQALLYAHNLENGPFPVVQAGAKGVLIGEWFEYTPTSGTDIAVTSNLATIA